ncbi:MAG: ASPIC/UnbV domain-containing protein [Candidatus Sulfotelmatobacter sp.]
MGSIVNPQHFSSTVTQFDDSLIYTRGRHVIKAGFQLQRYNLNVFYPGNAGELGAQVFGLGAGGNYSGNGSGGDPSADLALGLPESVGGGVTTGGWHGARVTYHAGDLKRSRMKVGGGSHLSSHDPRLVLGIGKLAKIDWVEIDWPQPSGLKQRLIDLPIDRYITIHEGQQGWK